MENLKIYIPLILWVTVFFHANAQTSVQGTVLDSVYQKTVEAGTIALYEPGKKSVYKVTLTDRYGKFEIEDIVAGKPLLLVLSMVGYEKRQIGFQLQAGEKKDFGNIHMFQISTEIDTVAVVPPVRMNKDTIEFNADAFELEDNAVVEDLLYKLPGIVIWGDGSITYNGREIPHVLVNGKPFFGSDKSVALQNIDKEAVEKLQIYDRRNEAEKRSDPENKKYEMNVVLKEGKESLYFGNAGAGLGTDKRHQEHANINLADKKSQVTLAYSGNNVNKDLAGIDQLLKNTTFKGVGINADFNSDFLRRGILDQQVVGARYQYDLNEGGPAGSQHMIRGDITGRWNKDDQTDESYTRLLNADHSYESKRSYQSHRQNDWRVQNAHLNYNKSLTVLPIGKRFLTVSLDLFGQNSYNRNVSDEQTAYDYLGHQSLNQVKANENHRHQHLQLDTRIELSAKDGSYFETDSPYGFWERLRFGLGIKAEFENRTEETDKNGYYTNWTDPSLNDSQNRTYDNSTNDRNLETTVEVSHGRVTFKQRMKLLFSEYDNKVHDFLNREIQRNDNLSHYSTYRQQEYEPSVEYLKTLWNRAYYGRSSNKLTLNLSGGHRFTGYDNQSSLNYRNVKSDYQNFFFKAILRNTYGKTGTYYLSSDLIYQYDEEHPAFDRQVWAIYDDIKPGYRYFGASEPLKMTGVNRLSGGVHYNQIRQHGIIAAFNLSYTVRQNALSDSIVFYKGRQEMYTVQTERPISTYGYEFTISKSYLLGRDQTLSATLKNRGNLWNNVQYIGSKEQNMRHKSIDFDLSLYYTFIQKLQIGVTNYLYSFGRVDKLNHNSVNNYRSAQWNTGMSIAYSVFRNFTAGSDMTRRSGYSDISTDKAVIWNAHLTYRFLKGDNMEVNLAVHDILKQNKGFYFIDGATEFTNGYKNILNQYYMLTLSYMPRKFGK